MEILPREEGDGNGPLNFPHRSGKLTQNRSLLACKPPVHCGLSQKWEFESIPIRAARVRSGDMYRSRLALACSRIRQNAGTPLSIGIGL
jgi:hypothetical protein